MTAAQIRESFLKYFEKHGHARRPSSSLVPDNDASVLLTTAGMQQFKAYFLGEKDPNKDFGSSRVATVQKCFRTSDIDEVGDTSHLTFFQMLGNFSFGDYWKTETIEIAWEYLTSILKLDPQRLAVTVFGGDDAIPMDREAEVAWSKFLPAARIYRAGRAENFWGPTGKSGPCGPSSEIHYQIDPASGGQPNGANYVEIWNLVFTEYLMDETGTLQQLPQRNIDTGMGLERLAVAVQKKQHVFETDIYADILREIRKTPGFGESAPEQKRRERIVADHVRGAVFLLADGVRFSNKDQGYILRRIVRRAADQFESSAVDLSGIASVVIENEHAAYPELQTQRPEILQLLAAEMAQYSKILNLDVSAIVRKMRKSQAGPEETKPLGPSHTLLRPEEAFTLFSTHGISLDRLERLGFEFERTEVEKRIAAHQALSRAGAEKKFGGHGLSAEALAATELPESDRQKMTRLHTATHLLHAALRRILGPEVKQMGSDINPERLRFDFSFHRKMSDEERRSVELLMNEAVRSAIPVTRKSMPYEQAIAEGALAFFKEKYPENVTVYTIGDFSKELCGGPHVANTSEVGKIRLVSDQSVGAGVRRVRVSI